MLLNMRSIAALAFTLLLGTSGVASAGENPRRATAAADAKVYPNPARDVIHIAFGSTTPNSIIVPSDQLRVTVHDVTGRLVCMVRDGPIDYGAGDHGAIVWDGRTASGQRVASGFYYIRIVMNGRVSVVKAWFIR